MALGEDLAEAEAFRADGVEDGRVGLGQLGIEAVEERRAKIPQRGGFPGGLGRDGRGAGLGLEGDGRQRLFDFPGGAGGRLDLVGLSRGEPGAFEPHPELLPGD